MRGACECLARVRALFPCVWYFSSKAGRGAVSD